MKRLTLLLALSGIVAIGVLQAQPHALPALPYAYDALEPSIDVRTMEIHHTRHHQAYVNNLNKAIAGTLMESWPLETLLLSAGRRGEAVRNNGGGHYNHTLFWEILSPSAAREPSGALAGAIRETYGSLDSVKTLLNQAASTRFGSGWAWLLVTVDGKLAVSSSPNQDNPLMDVSPLRGIPILGIDVWEHAYYLKYQNKRGDYLAAIWEVLDWKAVSERYDAALQDPLLRGIERDGWQTLKDFHQVMAQTFHPAEEGDLGPVRRRAGELSTRAAALRDGEIPAGFRTPAVKEALDKLAREAVALERLVGKGSDEAVKKAIYALHDRFHEVMEECEH
jgi:superoxide dismutase